MKISFKALRVNSELTQKEAAEMLGITPVTLQNWEAYTTYPSAQQLMQMCEIYHCELSDIFLPGMQAKS